MIDIYIGDFNVSNRNKYFRQYSTIDKMVII